MAPKLAYRNLFHDRLSLFVTLVGIVFSVVLLAFQSGIYLGIERTIAAVIDQTEGELWVVPIGTKSVDDPSLLPGRESYAVLSVPGVASVETLVMGFSRWRKRNGGATTVLLVGSDWTQGGFRPWNVIEGSVEELAAPKAVAVDKTYFKDLDVTGLGDPAEINGQTVTVGAVTKGIRSFTTMPYVFTTLGRAQSMLRANQEQGAYTLVKVEPDADIATVQARIQERLPDVEVLTRGEFRSRSINYWLFHTAAGSGLIAGTALALIVGIVIVAQTLYSSTKDHINEFATLRALGASSRYIIQVILLQALFSAVVGYALGMSLTLAIFAAAKGTTLNVVMTPGLALLLFLVTIGMCTIAAVSAIFKVTRIDPAGVFSR
ncbi:MAG: ABC transporter permease [Filomicrobium sp.]|nr:MULTISPECIES: ABC transporter permease [Filomicrobium]MCV0371389.1 ABC transporter permease [Filomicrobium sp.]